MMQVRSFKVADNGSGIGDVAVPECSIELQMFKIY